MRHILDIIKMRGQDPPDNMHVLSKFHTRQPIEFKTTHSPKHLQPFYAFLHFTIHDKPFNVSRVSSSLDDDPYYTIDIQFLRI